MSYKSDTYDAAGRDFDRMDARRQEADDWQRAVHEAAVELDNSAFAKLEECLHEIRIVAHALHPGACKDHLLKLLVKYKP